MISRPGIGICASVELCSNFEVRRYYIEEPVLIVVEEGFKTIRMSAGEFRIHGGQAIAVAGGQAIDIVDRTSDEGRYRARWLICNSALIEEYAQTHAQQRGIEGALPLYDMPDQFLDAYGRATAALRDPLLPDEVVKHRMAELLTWIGTTGHCFLPVLGATLSSKIRRMVNQEPTREWTAKCFADKFAMSEASLRRKLAHEGLCLSDIVTEIRMSQALRLLLHSRLPISIIATKVGYATASHFSVRFRERFGVNPAALRRREALDEALG
jgi:AraC-like DNA-binding protein